jgi:hypothetical protein
MAQADYVTNPIRRLITDASPIPSSNIVRANGQPIANPAERAPPSTPLDIVAQNSVSSADPQLAGRISSLASPAIAVVPNAAKTMARGVS